MGNDKTTPFDIKQLGNELEQLFLDSIDMTDYDGKKQNYKNDAFYSRALAAYSLYSLADISADEAAQSIVDGYDDNGIDAVFFQRKQNILWLVQAKWRKDGQKPPEAKELRSFKDGVFDLLDYGTPKNKARFNYKFECKEEEINAALNSPGLKIKVVIAYTAPKLSKSGRDVLEDLIDALNDGHEIGSIEDFSLVEASKALFERHNQRSIDVDFELSDWGRIDDPYQAFYGKINALTIGKWWAQHKNKLFSKNIREFIGSSNVNEEIISTLKNNPEIFWYLNNGITVLCDNISKIGAKKDRKQSGFTAKNISIVNGAQTIGCIGELYQELLIDEKESLEEAEISIKFISLVNCEENFGMEVTRATNTQNRVESRDFIALDEQQVRLGREFRSCGKRYLYKRTAENIVKDNKNYEIEEATVSLACAHKDVNLSITAKQNLSNLWSDPSKYSKIFNSNINAIQLAREIDIKRKLDLVIEEIEKRDEDKLLLAFVKHGNLFILNTIFQIVPRGLFSPDESESSFDTYKENKIPELANQIIEKSKQILEKNHKSGSLWSLFRSAKRWRELQEQIIKEIY